jgi:hypothetical protein
MITSVIFPIFCLGIPLWMCFENWDDHNRAGRTFQVDNARNILASCRPNAILFTGGDNDTFPLWYLQEVEGYRTDVRVMVLSYFNTDWYINQLRKKYYDSEPFVLTLNEKAIVSMGPTMFFTFRKYKGDRLENTWSLTRASCLKIVLAPMLL